MCSVLQRAATGLGLAVCLTGSVAAMSVLPAGAARRAQEAAVPAPRAGAVADKILVNKGQRRLYLMRDGKPFRTYRVSLGIAPEGHKQRQGDNRTPEGRYSITGRNARSNFYKALHISYPNPQDRLEAARRGWDPGGAIMIHGEPRRMRFPELRDAVRGEDWTQGCIAVSNMAVDEIWRYVRDGTPIEIVP